MKWILLVVLALSLCVGCSEKPTFSFPQVEGPSYCYLVWMMYDNSLWLYTGVLPNAERIHVVSAQDKLAPARDIIDYGSRVEEVSEYDSCDPSNLRAFILKHKTQADYLVVHISGHGIPGWGMGPDYSAQSVMQWKEIVEGVNGLGVDLLLLDGCKTFDDEMIELLRGTDIKNMVGSIANVTIGAMHPQHQIIALASHNWTPREYCQQHWGAMPDAFNWVELTP